MGVYSIDIGKGGVGGQGSTRAAKVRWARSWSSCSSSGDRNGRSSTGLVAMGVLSSGVEVSESSFLAESESKPSEGRGVSMGNGGRLFR